jgi:catalase
MFRDFERTIVALQRSMAQRGDGTLRRGFHAKTLLNVPRAMLRVDPNIPLILQVGIFQPGREYAAVVRFSSSLADVQPDANKQGHGIGIRVQAPEGPHDILLSDSATSHARDAEQFMALADALTSRLKIVTVLRLMRRVGISEALRMLRVVLRTSTSNMASPATVPYWSRTAFSFAGAAARLVLRPRATTAGKAGSGPNYLTEELTRRLAAGDIEFDLAAQLFLDEERTPIEDGSIDWRESDTPPLPLARLILPRQDLTSDTARRGVAEIERLAFTPWNVVGDIHPLGSLNRARKPVYLASARERGGAITEAPTSSR